MTITTLDSVLQSAFAGLSAPALQRIAACLQQLRFAAGQEIIRQGDAGDACYIVAAGRAEVVVRDGEAGLERRLDVIETGDRFGELALISGEQCSATVRAIEPLEVLRLATDDYQGMLRDHPEHSEYFHHLALQRQRPRHSDNWSIQRLTGRRGEAVYILKNARTRTYLRLSEQTGFLWELMDGRRTVRELTLEYFRRYRIFGLQAVLDVMLQLNAAGCITMQPSGFDRERVSVTPGRWQRLHAWLLASTVRLYSLPDVDRTITSLHRVLRPLYSRIAQLLLLVAATVGALVCLLVLGGWGGAGLSSSAATLVMVGIAGSAIHGVLHELAHAVTCKHFGCEVHRAGVGWYLYAPVAFVDTSDIWLAERGARAAVAFAGSYINFVLSGAAMLLLALVDDAAARAVLFQFALIGYGMGLTSLDPLIEFDGYHILTDWLDLPNLRTGALAFVGGMLSGAGPTTRDPRLRRIYTLYGLLALAYTLLLAVVVAVTYRGYIQDLVRSVLPPLAADLLGWAIAGTMLMSIVLYVGRDLRRGMRPRAGKDRAIGFQRVGYRQAA